MVERLSDFPWVIVRVDCPLCPHRKGQYRLARLAEKYGPDIQVCDLMDRFRLSVEVPLVGAASRPIRSNVQGSLYGLGVYQPPSPDHPPIMRKLKVIQGDRK